MVWALVRVFLGPWSEFSPARSETLGRGRRMSVESPKPRISDFSGKVLIVSRTLSGMFLVGAFEWAEKRGKGQIGEVLKNRENPQNFGPKIRESQI